MYSTSYNARPTLVGLVFLVAGSLSACGGSGVNPDDGPLEISIEGDVGAYSEALVRIEDEVTLLTVESGRIHGSIEGVDFGNVDLEFELVRDRVDVSPDEIHSRFDEILLSVLYGGAPVVLQLEQLDRREMVSMARPEGTAFFLDDPCRPSTRVETDALHVDADRALYRGMFQELLRFIFASTSDYAGEDLLGEAEGRVEFEAACLGGEWDTADTLVCLEPGSGVLTCMYYTWSRTTPP